MEEREWPPVDLKAYILEQRQLIDADRRLYADWKPHLAKWSTELWKAVAATLKARSRYHRGEIVRAKHDLQRFALGEDPRKPSHWGAMNCDWADIYLGQIDTEGFMDGFKDQAEIQLKVDQFNDLAKDLERITYGG